MDLTLWALFFCRCDLQGGIVGFLFVAKCDVARNWPTYARPVIDGVCLGNE